MKNLLSRLEKSLRWVKTHHRYLESRLRHPEFISGSQESRQMLKQVLHDNNLSGQMLKQVQHSNCVGWCRTSFSIGRSMIEMLGVLAIIGVLSIGGLYAYQQAMMRYRLGQTQDWLSRARLVLAEYCADYPEKCLNGDSSGEGYIARRNLLCAMGGVDFCSDATDSYVPHPYLPDVRWAVLFGLNRYNFLNFYFYIVDQEDICKMLIQHDWDNLYRIEFLEDTVPPQTVSARGKPLTQVQKDILKAGCVNHKKFLTIVFYGL